jgi:small-conductance mechanosensitive channel
MTDPIENWLFDPTVGKIVTAIVGILIVVGVVRFLQKTVTVRIKDTDTRYRVRKFVSFIGYILGIILLATVFSDRLGGLTVALGVAGAGIAFALQEVIASIAGWFAISFANFYKTGDRVQLGGIKGDVIDVGILRTTLMEVGEWVKGDLYNGRMVRIANSFVFKEPVFNYSGDFPFLWDEITVPVKYGSDYRMAREMFNNVAQEILGKYADQAAAAWKDMVKRYLIEDAAVKPMVTMIFNDNWVEYTIRYVVDYKKRRGTKDILFSRLIEEIEKSGGKISLASATFELVGVPDLNVITRKK